MSAVTGIVIIAILITALAGWRIWLDYKIRLVRLEKRPSYDWTTNHSVANAVTYSHPVPQWWRDAPGPDERGIVQVDMTSRSIDELPNVDHLHDLNDQCIRNRTGDLCVTVQG